MFTGIIEELGTVQDIKQSRHAMSMSIAATAIFDDVKLGDSIAVNGVCLTVTAFTKTKFTADVMPETFKATSLSQLKLGSKVNLERAMAANGRFGGHFVSGHVDGIAKILRKKSLSNAIYIELVLPDDLIANCIQKGSITVDGTSLTIFKISHSVVTVSLIPHTYKQTVLGFKSVGEIVNIETDLIGKYIAKHVNNDEKVELSRSFLQQAGF